MSVTLHAWRDESAQAARLADILGITPGYVNVHVFPDGELAPRVPAPAPTTIVYRSLNNPNTKLVELLLAAEAWRRGGARRLILVAPYLPYMRQDKAFREGEPVSQRVITGLLDSIFDRILTVDPHLHRTQSLEELFGKGKCTHVHCADALGPYLRRTGADPNMLVIGPDIEAEPWVRRIADPLGLRYAILEKVRHGDTRVALSAPSGLAPAGRPVLLVDDILSTGHTLREAIVLLRRAGAGRLCVFVTHVLGGMSVVRDLIEAGADEVLSTDSCSHGAADIPLAGVLGAALADEIS